MHGINIDFVSNMKEKGTMFEASTCIARAHNQRAANPIADVQLRKFVFMENHPLLLSFSPSRVDVV